MSHPAILADLRQLVDTLQAARDQSAPRFLSVERAADYVSLSTKSIRRLIAAGKITALRPCKGKIVIDKHQLDSLVLASNARPRTGRGRR